MPSKDSQKLKRDHPAVRRLLELYARGGCIRVPNMKLRKSKSRTYKKGYEIRFIARNADDLAQVQQVLKELRAKVSSPYAKNNQIIQPVYGKVIVQWFQSLLK